MNSYTFEFIQSAKTNQVYWGVLSANPNAIHILEQNLDKVNWEMRNNCEPLTNKICI